MSGEENTRPQPGADEWVFTRYLNGSKALLRANFIPSLSVWGITCKLNGVLVEHCQSDNPLFDGPRIIAEAFANYL